MSPPRTVPLSPNQSGALVDKHSRPPPQPLAFHRVQLKLYIPPQGLYFRLLGYDSQRVLFSRTHAEPQVFHHPVAYEYNDQYFTLVPGTGVRKGLYLIKSKQTDKVLFSRTHAVPNVWHVDGNGDYDDKSVMPSLFVLRG